MHPWRERLDRWFRPVASRVPLSANAITVIAFVLNLAGATAMALAADQPTLWLVAPGIIAVAGLLDALDGVVARTRGESSTWGDFLDHTLDRASDSAILIGWILGSSQRAWLGLTALAMAAFVGYLGTQLEASFGTRDYEDLGRGEFVLALVIFPITGWSLASADLMDTLWFGFTLPEWMTLLILAAMSLSVLQRFRRAHRLSSEVD